MPEASLAIYEEKLEGLVQRCERMVDGGLAYMAVVLCHELVRYTYPHEPVKGFTHTNPANFMIALVDKLSGVADASLAGIEGYSFDLEKQKPAAVSVEMKTSSLYSDLWNGFTREQMEKEALALLKNRIPETILTTKVKGKKVVDIGCGSGRYTLALAALGGHVTGVDFQPRSYQRASEIAKENGLDATFQQANVLELPFADASFDFVFCNGVLHHTQSMERGLDEYVRVMKPGGSGFLYLYGAGGIFWNTRKRLRELFKKIPFEYTQAVFGVMGVPGNRFVFCDTWYVPIERHTTTRELEGLLTERKVTFEKLISKNLIDLEGPIARGEKDAAIAYGDGDNRYFVEKPA